MKVLILLSKFVLEAHIVLLAIWGVQCILLQQITPLTPLDSWSTKAVTVYVIFVYSYIVVRFVMIWLKAWLVANEDNKG